MRLQFAVIKKYPERATYGAIHGEFTFVITLTESAEFHASVKRVGAVVWDGTRIDLGNFRRFVDAAEACEKYALKHAQ